MRYKKLAWVAATFAVVVAAGLIVAKCTATRDERDYREQLRLARAEGLPTKAAEYAATIPFAKPEENAAPLYRSLQHKLKGDFDQASIDLLFHPSATKLTRAKDMLAVHQGELQTIDRAVKLPRCWFNRNWSLGPALLMPEYADMKSAAKLVSLRSSVAAYQGHLSEALRAVQTIFIIAKHSREEPHAVSHLVGEAIHAIAVRDLSWWAFIRRDRKEYVEALKKAIEAMPKPNMRLENRTELMEVLAIVDLASSPSGVKELGLRDQNGQTDENIVSRFMNKTRARTKIVTAEREQWAALARPREDRAEAVQRASSDLYSALLAFPAATTVLSSVDGGVESILRREPAWEADQQRRIAILCALEGNGVAKSIKTSDLLSPFDGKPLRYRYDGNRIVVEVSRGEGPITTQIPPDAAFKKQ